MEGCQVDQALYESWLEEVAYCVQHVAAPREARFVLYAASRSLVTMNERKDPQCLECVEGTRRFGCFRLDASGLYDQPVPLGSEARDPDNIDRAFVWRSLCKLDRKSSLERGSCPDHFGRKGWIRRDGHSTSWFECTRQVRERAGAWNESCVRYLDRSHWSHALWCSVGITESQATGSAASTIGPVPSLTSIHVSSCLLCQRCRTFDPGIAAKRSTLGRSQSAPCILMVHGLWQSPQLRGPQAPKSSLRGRLRHRRSVARGLA